MARIINRRSQRRTLPWEKLALLLLPLSIDYVSAFSISSRCPRKPTHLAASSSWSGYDQKNQLEQSFRRDGGILYKTSVFSQQELSIIESEVAKLNLQKETSSIARNRMGAILARQSETTRILREGTLMELVRKIVGSDFVLSTDIPVELRVYEKTGAGMDWHVDDILYEPSPQLEVVITLENTSDCQTMWRSPGDSIKTVETDVNSAILLQAGGVPHCVSSLKRGRRAILKCAYVDLSATFRQDEMVNQFGSRKKKKR